MIAPNRHELLLLLESQPVNKEGAKESKGRPQSPLVASGSSFVKEKFPQYAFLF